MKRTRKAEIEANREQGLVFSSDAYHLYYGKNQANEAEKKPDDDDPEGVNK